MALKFVSGLRSTASVHLLFLHRRPTGVFALGSGAQFPIELASEQRVTRERGLEVHLWLAFRCKRAPPFSASAPCGAFALGKSAPFPMELASGQRVTRERGLEVDLWITFRCKPLVIAQ